MVIMQKNQISVVIPTHNRREGLKASLQSLYEQTCLPDEIIVIDDGSSSAVNSSIFSIFPEEVKCVLLRNEIPKGGNNARNQGVMAAGGEYIAFLDDDDQFKPNKIEVLQAEITANPTVDIFYHPAHIHMLNEGVSYFAKPYVFAEKEDVFRTLLTQNKIGGTPMVAVRRKVLLSVGLFDENMPSLQDYELWLRLAKNNHTFKLINQPLTDYYYTTKKSSVSKSVDVNRQSIGLIERKYQDSYATLTGKELKSYETWKKKMIVHKHLLNGQKSMAIKQQFALFKSSPSVTSLLQLLVMFLGTTAVFKLKAKLG